MALIKCFKYLEFLIFSEKSHTPGYILEPCTVIEIFGLPVLPEPRYILGQPDLGWETLDWVYFGTPCTGINSEALCNLTCSSSCSSWSRNWSPSWSSSTWSRLLFWSATWSRFSSCSSIFRPRSCSGSTISGSPRFPNLRKFLRTRVVYLDNITSSINYSSVYSYVNNNISPNQGRVSRLNNIVFKLLLYVRNNISYYRRNSALTGN